MLSIMSDTSTPWLGDACSLVEAFRSGERNPVDELEATLAAVAASELNAVSFVAADQARAAAKSADVSKPLGGVPIGVKELDRVAGWPNTSASVPLRDRVGSSDTTMIERLRDAGAVLFGMTTASEFGGINLTFTKLNGVTRNPWNLEHTPGGSSGGAASSVAGGLATLGTGGDGGGSIRIPASFTGLFGLKATYGRIPKGPETMIGNLTSVVGCLSRSVRDTARYFDVCMGFDRHDPYSLPAGGENWEAGLGTRDLAGKKVVVRADLGEAVLHPEVRELVTDAAAALVKLAGLEVVDVPFEIPSLGSEWALSGSAGVKADLGDLYPGCLDELTPQIQFIMKIADEYYNLERRARIEERRVVFNEAMADLFDQVDFVICATCPDVAFGAKGPMPTQVGDEMVSVENNGALTIPANIYGNPGVSIPVGLSRGLPVGMQVMGRHFSEPDLLDLALAFEAERPWPLVAPGAPV